MISKDGSWLILHSAFFFFVLQRHGVAATYCEMHPNVLKRFALSERDEV